MYDREQEYTYLRVDADDLPARGAGGRDAALVALDAVLASVVRHVAVQWHIIHEWTVCLWFGVENNLLKVHIVGIAI